MLNQVTLLLTDDIEYNIVNEDLQLDQFNALANDSKLLKELVKLSVDQIELLSLEKYQNHQAKKDHRAAIILSHDDKGIFNSEIWLEPNDLSKVPQKEWGLSHCIANDIHLYLQNLISTKK